MTRKKERVEPVYGLVILSGNVELPSMAGVLHI